MFLNTEVALNLARELEVTVDDLFSLPGWLPESCRNRSPPKSSARKTPVKGQPVRICQIGSRWVSVPVSASPYYMPEADGIIKHTGRTSGRADLVVFAKDEAAQKRIVLAGCDPAAGLLSRHGREGIQRRGDRLRGGVEQAGARLAQRKAKVHIAGSHLEDAKTGEFNRPFHPRALFRMRSSSWSRSRAGKRVWWWLREIPRVSAGSKTWRRRASASSIGSPAREAAQAARSASREGRHGRA